MATSEGILNASYEPAATVIFSLDSTFLFVIFKSMDTSRLEADPLPLIEEFGKDCPTEMFFGLSNPFHVKVMS